MTVDLREVQAHAFADAAAWWQNRPFPYQPDGSPYRCTACGRPIMHREGTSLIGPEMRCPACTAEYFAPRATTGAPGYPPAPPAYLPAAPQPATGYPTPPAYPPPPQPPAVQRRPNRRRNLIIVAAVLAAVGGLVAGLLVWAPWHKEPPAVPQRIATFSSSATALTVSWTQPTSGAHADKFLILRDGRQIAAAPGARRAYTDKGLRPGMTYRYQVVAVAGSRRSAASDVVYGHTTTPPPVAVHKTAVGATWIAVAWSPPDAPAPSAYYVTVDGVDVTTLSGTTTAYRATGLTPATGYDIRVAAEWGTARSVPSSTYVVHTSTPAVSAARLSGTMSLQMQISSTGGGNIPVGKHWSESWTFSPLCGSGPCSVSLDGDFTPPGFNMHSFRMTLHRHGGVYTGQTRAHITHCGEAPLIFDVRNTVAVRVTVKAAQVSGSDWLVSRFTGTMRISSPYTQAGSYYCPAQSVTTSLASTG
jgi:Fibronectin type III domain